MGWIFGLGLVVLGALLTWGAFWAGFIAGRGSRQAPPNLRERQA